MNNAVNIAAWWQQAFQGWQIDVTANWNWNLAAASWQNTTGMSNNMATPWTRYAMWKAKEAGHQAWLRQQMNAQQQTNVIGVSPSPGPYHASSYGGVPQSPFAQYYGD